MKNLSWLFVMPERRQSAGKTPYRPDIDGLRSLAILAVMLFHAFPKFLRSGFVGVDIFFVISGFLISRIVFTGLAKGSFSFINFYVHRIRRIFPAMVLVLFSTIVVGWFAMVAEEYRILGKHVAGGIGFINNFLLWGEDGYFGTRSELKPLMHLWSLGIEEQFYLIFPALLVVLWQFRISLILIIALLLLLSFWANLHWMQSDSAGSFFLPHTRFWELLAGGLLAYSEVFKLDLKLLTGRGRRLRKLARNAELRSSLGLILLAAGFIFISKSSSFPGYWALLPVVGTCLIISAGPKAWVNRNLFANRGMVFVGLISYPLYMWHWPILSFMRIVEVRTPAVPFRGAALVMTFLLAWLTYRYVEHPLRFGGRVRTKAIGLLVSGIFLGAAGLAIYYLDGVPQRDVERRFGEYLQDVGHKRYFEEMAKFSTCHSEELSLIGGGCWQTGVGQENITVAIVGDSHAADIFLGMAAHRFEDQNLVLLPVACYPLIGIRGSNSCPTASPAIDYIVSNKEIRTVILANYWAFRLKDKTIRLEGEPDNENRVDIFERSLALTLEKLNAAGKQVVFAMDIPNLNFAPEECLPSRPFALNKRDPGKDCRVSRQFVDAAARDYSAAVERILAKHPKVTKWDRSSKLCNETDCLVATEGILLYRDDNHLSLRGLNWLMEDSWRQIGSSSIHENGASLGR